jgi:L-rhamnose mutarotase
MTVRACFQLQVKPEWIDEYVRRHAEVWPEMLTALAETGWRNYSLFLRPDGLLIGYFESDDVDAAVAAMAETEVNTRWQAEMAPLFVDPGAGNTWLPEVFNLDEQLGHLDP